MKLSRKKSIELCIELWTWLVETGKFKDNWPEWGKYDEIEANCWFCEYDSRQNKRYKYNRNNCEYCPLMQADLDCGNSDSPYQKWNNARTPRTRKKYAGLFLEQIKSLRSKRQ